MINLRHLSKQLAGRRTCGRLVPMHLQCGKSKPSPSLVTKPGSNRRHEQAVHGLSIPLGKLGYYLPRTISRSITENNDSAVPSGIRSRLDEISLRLPTFSTSRRNSLSRDRRSSSDPDSRGASRVSPVRAVWRTGGTVIPTEAVPAQEDQQTQSPSDGPGPLVAPCDQPSGERGTIRLHVPEQEAESGDPLPPPPAPRPVPGPMSRTIRFPDDTA